MKRWQQLRRCSQRRSKALKVAHSPKLEKVYDAPEKWPSIMPFRRPWSARVLRWGFVIKPGLYRLRSGQIVRVTPHAYHDGCEITRFS